MTSKFADQISALVDNIEKVIVGKGDVVKIATATLLSQGHLLVEDVPGVGKTTLAKAIARSVDCQFSRVQATSDLLPSDILGVSIYNQKKHEFEFQPGPIFTNILLVDEVNRATPRTQSSLLQAMNEFEVTIDRITRELANPFFVIATQNPVEQVGTYLLPESQLDRFAARVTMGYPSLNEEDRILTDQQESHPIEELLPVLTSEELCSLQAEVRKVRVDEKIRRYILDITRQTRDCEEVTCGASPRASLVLCRMSQAWALMAGRDYCLPDDPKELAVPVLSHRLILPSSLRSNVEEQRSLVKRILDGVEVP